MTTHLRPPHATLNTPSRFVLVDRDGVINQDSEAYITSPAEWQPIPGSLEAIALLTQHGYGVVVITNQSGLARGLFDVATLERIHAKMCQAVSQVGGVINAIYYCPHNADDACACRKPKPGLLERFAQDTQTVLAECYFIGDSYRDIQAGLSAGAQPILVKTGNGQLTAKHYPHLNVPVFENLYEAVQYILSR
ncbi:MAG: D-glycero-beta-D-manno-heptose 1,7-bisphosphate 7-phosphatase [Methylococcaceae bacterium]|nr:MAG: D-glycero-beta-D-manno-heptose 1,7-bisphosphate 7-phosphatase [Methylococcaceae bacterium]